MRARTSLLQSSVRCALASLVATLLCAGRADAQWNGFLNINGSVQTDDRTVTHALTESLYGETATYEATMTSPGGGLLDAWLGMRVWGDLGVSVGATVLNARGATSISGSVPSPLFRNRHRAASIERQGLNHQQVGVHLPLVYVLPVSERIHVAVSAGPSWFRLRHDELTAVTLGGEVAPYTAVGLAGFAMAEDEGTGFGYNAGLDVTYLQIRNFGVGLFLRYTGGSVQMDFPDGARSVKVGGAQGGAGLRFRF
jgi:hypothetical protein